MSWNFHAQSCNIHLAEVKSKSEFDTLLNLLASRIWHQYIHEDCVPDHFGCDDIPQNEEAGVPFIANGLMQYVTQFECREDGASFVIYSEYDTEEYGDIELSEKISEFLLLKSNLRYILTESSASDKCGAYAHQWITFKDKDQIHSMSTESFLDLMLKKIDFALPAVV
jgi:hypothetical protein